MTQYDEVVYQDHTRFMMPDYQWEYCFAGDWDSITVRTMSAPNKFQRIMQRLVLGIHWREIKR